MYIPGKFVFYHIIFQVIATETLTGEKFSGNATVIVQLKNLNDNKPVFVSKTYTFTSSENISIGYHFGAVKVFVYLYFHSYAIVCLPITV